MIVTPPEDIKAIVKRMGEAGVLGEQHAAAGTLPPGMIHGYNDKDLKDAYLICMKRQIRIMRGEKL